MALEAHGTPKTVETEFHDGDSVDVGEPEDEFVDTAERPSPMFEALNVGQLIAILG